ncbi:hypothetical protein RJT34_13047 [Clitoria ternatea]|uniref:Uncharacterized protein n=1 Tax=Clitoria ternatea TaxID=43366 RepID=A0AAN9PL30_CLITE
MKKRRSKRHSKMQITLKSAKTNNGIVGNRRSVGADMDGDMGRWLLEFLVGSPITDTNIMKKLIFKIPISNPDFRLKKTLLLKTLQHHLSSISISESLLRILELLEELHRLHASPITPAMAAAYCSVAVECTLKFLQFELHNNPTYINAVQRIWRRRIRHMDPSEDPSGVGSLMFSDELNRWRNDIEASVLDLRARERLASVDSRRDAIQKLKVYLEEAWANVGPSFLEIATSMHPNNSKSLQRGSGNIQRLNDNVVDARDLVHQDEVSAIEIQKDNKLHEGKDTTWGFKEVHPFTTDNRVESVSNSEVQKVRESLKCIPLKLQTSVKDIVQNVGESLEGSSLKLQTLVKEPVQNVGESLEHSSLGLQAKDPVHTVGGSFEGSSLGLRTLAKDQVDSAGGPLEGSSSVLQTSANYPVVGSLLQVSDTSWSELEMNDMNHEPLIENQSRNMDEPCSHACQNINNDEANMNRRTSVLQSGYERQSLLEKNSTARTYEWDDATDDLQGTETNHAGKFKLPSPKRPKLSPLKKYEPTHLSKRRKAKKWSELEEETLKTAVDKFGRGNWKLILNSHQDIFEERTEVDLKDKWRNMTRYGCK